MKYTLTKETKIHKDKTTLTIVNPDTGADVELKSFSTKVFEMIISEDDSKIIKYLLEHKCKDEVVARKTLNSLIYTLLDLKLITPKIKTKVKNHNINLSTTAIELTSGCNFRCPHCYVDKSIHNSLDFDTTKSILDELRALGACQLLLTGGEILTHKDFKAIYEYAYKKGFIISLNTNGSLFNKSMINYLKKMPPKSIQISVYGKNEETYHNFTNRTDQFELVLNNIKALKAAGLDVSCKNVITKSNIGHFREIMKLCEDMGVPFRMDYISFPSFEGKNRVNPEQISPAEALEFVKEEPTSQRHYLKVFNSNTSENKYVFECRHDDDGVFITSDGFVNICPCMQTIHYKYQKGKLLDCLINLKEIGKIEFKKRSKCKNCKYMPLCRYCPAKFQLTTGDYEKPAKWFCQFGKLMYKTFIKGLRFNPQRGLTSSDLKHFNNIQNLASEADSGYKKWKPTPNGFFIEIYKEGKEIGLVEVSPNNGSLNIFNFVIHPKQNKKKILSKLNTFIKSL